MAYVSLDFPFLIVPSGFLLRLCALEVFFFTLRVPCCDVRYNFRIKTMFVSSLPPVICRRAHVLFTLFDLVCVLWCPTHIVLCFCFVCIVSCVPYVASFSGMSILDCSFGILLRLFCLVSLHYEYCSLILSNHEMILRTMLL